MPKIKHINYNGRAFELSGSGAVDATLTQSGMAADAKAVGDAIAALQENFTSTYAAVREALSGNPTAQAILDQAILDLSQLS